MMNSALLNIAPVTPEIFLSSMACVVLLVDLVLTDRNRFIVYALTQATLLGTLLLLYNTLSMPPSHAFSGMFVHDGMSVVLKIAMTVMVMFAFVYSRSYLQERDMYRGEYFVLGLFGLVGMMVIASASHLLSLYMGLELMSLCLYAMVAFRRDSVVATEAAMKYFILGALASGLLLYGMSLIYGVTHTLDITMVRKTIGAMEPGNIPLIFGLVFVLSALAFKLGAVPFHMWVPDVYQGAPTSVTAYLSTAPKIAAFAMFMRLLVGGLEGLAEHWQTMLVIIAILSMAVGNIIAIAQTNIKRMLAYSAISHMGFLLLGILAATKNGYSSAMLYALVYASMSLAAFGLIMLLSRSGFESEELDDFKGLNQRNPWLAFLMMITMFSMAGVPPTVGFYAKFMVIQAVVDIDMVWLAIVAVLLAVIGVFYYLRVVKLMYFEEATDSMPIEARTDVRWALNINVIALILVMPFIGKLTEWCIGAVNSLL